MTPKSQHSENDLSWYFLSCICTRPNKLVILRAAKRSRRIYAAVDEHTPLDSATSRGMTGVIFVMYLYVAQ
jgi:hypothetical protein